MDANGGDERFPLLAGRYRLLGRLGSGGMGVVWRAYDEVLGREVAVKEVRAPEHLREADVRVLHARLVQEARAAARISHPYVITVHDVVEEHGRPWIVMELVRGRSLADVLEADGLLSPKEAARVGSAVLLALRSAHAAGVLHRDVKPANVLLQDDGRVVLTDFGIALVEGTGTLTRTGDVIGSPDYLAPERALGKHPGTPSDLWSLGATLYAAVEGMSPFRRASALGTLQAVVHEDPPAPRRAGPLAPLLLGLLRKDPSARMGSVEAQRLLNAAAAAPAVGGRTGTGAGAAFPHPGRSGGGPGERDAHGTAGGAGSSSGAPGKRDPDGTAEERPGARATADPRAPVPRPGTGTATEPWSTGPGAPARAGTAPPSASANHGTPVPPGTSGSRSASATPRTPDGTPPAPSYHDPGTPSGHLPTYIPTSPDVRPYSPSPSPSPAPGTGTPPTPYAPYGPVPTPGSPAVPRSAGTPGLVAGGGGAAPAHGGRWSARRLTAPLLALLIAGGGVSAVLFLHDGKDPGTSPSGGTSTPSSAPVRQPEPSSETNGDRSSAPAPTDDDSSGGSAESTPGPTTTCPPGSWVTTCRPY
ncbi:MULTISPECIES: serine/threonine-protein kinase [Streptomyces]|uniref:serine/threonine-protein kinase n=1 Tax=Streptomyces TaxID=1883 RepID=UPI001C8D810C|nr:MULTISPECIES: serine/threonine-protein kinase [Streptomyces]UBI40402.1 protein kinase [Streptomyces mobaraensis]UKW32984.1 protein kinase [Streptomyces sp. TYQ1024]